MARGKKQLFLRDGPPRRGRPPKIAEDDAPLSAEPGPGDAEDPEDDVPDLGSMMDEPAGGEQSKQDTTPDPFGLGAAGLSNPWDAVASQVSQPRIAEQNVDGDGSDAGDDDDAPEPPGSQAPVDEGTLTRRWMIDYPDDSLVTVKLFEIMNNVNAEPVGVWHNVVLSKAKEPESWIEYGGDWIVAIIHPDTKKVLVRKRIHTRGEKAPKWWRPNLGGDTEMDPKQLAEAMRYFQMMGGNLNGGGTPGMPGPNPSAMYGDVTGQLRGDLAESRAEAKRLADKVTDAERLANDAKNDRNILQMRLDTKQDEINRINHMMDELKNELRDLRNRPSNPGGKPEWAWAMEANSKNQLSPTDLIALLTKNNSDPSQAFGTLNAALDLVKKVQGPAVPAPTGFSIDGLSKFAPLAEKALDLVAGKQKIVGDQTAAMKARAEAQAAEARAIKNENTVITNKADAAITTTLDRIVDAVKAGEEPEKVGFVLGTAIDWAMSIGVADANEMAKGIINDLMIDPEKTIIWVCAQNGRDEAYARKVAAGFRIRVKALGGTLPEPKALETAPKAVVAEPATPAKPEGDAKDGVGAEGGKGNGGAHASPVDGAAATAESKEGGDSKDVPTKPADNSSPSGVKTVN